MKNLRTILIAGICLAITACINGQMHRTVTGDHNVVRKDREAGHFTGIRVNSGIDVYLKQTGSESIVVEADENLHEYIKTEIRDGILHVYSDANIRGAEMKRVYVTMKDIESAKTTSAGDIIGESPVNATRLELGSSSAGDIKLEVHATEIDADLNSSGDMTLSGDADKLTANLSSAGDLNAFNLEVKKADISVSSAGNADVNVTEDLIARASSAGEINYRGNPSTVDAHSSSAGGIHKRQ